MCVTILFQSVILLLKFFSIFIGNLSIKLADFKETLTNEIKSKLQKIFDEDSNEWVNQCNYLEQLNPSEFTDLKEFNERLNTCKLRVSFFSDFHSACTKMNFKTDYATAPFTQKPCLLRLFFLYDST